MFTALSEQLTGVLQRLRGRGVLSEADVTDALPEIRRHLLEADVIFEVTRAFVERVRERAVGALEIKAVSPGQQVAKLVHDEIARMLGAEIGPDGRPVGERHAAPLHFASVGPTVILLVGLQGSGKTTTAAKLARRRKLEQEAPCLVAADAYRPAAGGELDPWRDRRPDQVRRSGWAAGRPRAGGSRAAGGPDPGTGRRRRAGRKGGNRDGRSGGAATRAEGAVQEGDGSGRLLGGAQADAGDGAAQTGAGLAARRERAGVARPAERRQAAEARRGDRALDDAGGARRARDPERIAAPTNREGCGPAGTGSQSPAGAVSADEAATQKDLSIWRLAFGCGAWAGRGRATSGS